MTLQTAKKIPAEQLLVWERSFAFLYARSKEIRFLTTISKTLNILSFYCKHFIDNMILYHAVKMFICLSIIQGINTVYFLKYTF